MFGYIICAVLLAIIISIITEHLVLKRLKTQEGIDIKKGVCVLKHGYGKIDTVN
jgi:uncharacterized membrane protein YadS